MASELIGKKLGDRYEIRKLIGEGGMAEVYEAYHPKLDRIVAAKLMHRHLSREQEFRARFEQEARAIARLKHPNIIQVYDFDFDKSTEQFYMIIEYVDGPTLSSVLKGQQGHVNLAQTLRIIEQTAEALGYAHAEAMQHRDIKPSNIMLDRGERTVLTDFGIAKLLAEGGQQLTASGAMVGTPAYMSPEQANGVPGDHRSDIYSLGIVFYQMATGQLPYQGETPIATVLMHLREIPKPPSQLNPELPLGIESTILRCIAKDPKDRYQSTRELLDHLRNQDLAAAQITQSITLSTKLLSDDAFTAMMATPHNTPSGTATQGQITDTLIPDSNRTSLIIGAGAVAIIALLALGAFLFSTAGSTSSTDEPVVNACIITLEESILGRTEPNTDRTATIELAADGEFEFVRQVNDFYLLRSDDAEAWVTNDDATVPSDCEID